ncbi:hypothetical protein NHX12_023354, partial [Muraenolepis orangiensis]
MASPETPPPSLRQGVWIAPHDISVSVEEALLAAGEQVGHENLVFASRMNKAVVVFVKSEQKVHQLVASGVFIRDLYVQVSPLSVLSTRITVSGVPPLITNELLENELQRFGKFASGFKTLSPEEKAALDLERTLEELTGAVNQMASGRARGINGLSGEFFQSASEPDPSRRP